MSDNYWNLIKDASNEVKLALIKRLSDALRPAVAEKKARKKKLNASDYAGIWDDMDDDMLNAALAKFHKDWGGEEDAMAIAEELRSSLQVGQERAFR